MAKATSSLASTPRELYLIGIGTGHSVAPPMHNYIARSLNLPWTFHTKECFTIEECMTLLQSEVCAGAAVTMPYKGTILDRLDKVDELARTLAACNTVYVDADGKLRGTNVDWCGIAGSLSEGAIGLDLPSTKAAIVIGAGGAARAAVYALSSQMRCYEIYILNRDKEEVLRLKRDVQERYASRPSITHVQSVKQAQALSTPTYIVSTVPDVEPITPEEKTLKTLLATFLERTDKGIMLDVCYNPRRTRHIKLGQTFGWRTIEGMHVIGHQAEHQWRAWAGDERIQNLDKKGLWECLRQSADESPIVNSKI
jgi:quinate dehydrogenase